MRRARAMAAGQQYAPLIPWNQWRTLSDGDKFQAIAGFSLDDALRFQSIPFELANLHERNAKLQIFQAVLKVGVQSLKQGDRRRETEALLETVASSLRAHTSRSPSDD
jgi:hypothetical protein